MGHKKDNSNLVSFLTLVSFSALVLAPAGQIIPLLFPVVIIQLLLPGSSSFIKRTYYPIWFGSTIFVCFVINRLKISATVATGVPLDCITSISGVLVYDSSFTQMGNNYMAINLKEVESIFGQTVTARGLLNVVGNTKYIITSGTKITLYGRFNNNLFQYTSLQVTEIGYLGQLREKIIVAMEKRLLGQSPSEPAILSTMLIVGRAEYYGSSFKQKAQNCGCSHVLALSGMHLNTISSIFKPVPIKWLKYLLSVLVSSLFVFIAGPRPSLIRALLMLVFRFLPLEERITVCFITQLFIFPFSMVNTGCIYSYLSIIALVFIAPAMRETIKLRAISASVSVMLLISPLSIITDGLWYPCAILAGPISGALIALSMLCGLLILVFGQTPYLTRANTILFNTLKKVFDYFGNLPTGTWKEYIIFALITVFLLLFGIIGKHIMIQRFKKISKNPIIKL